MLEYLPDPRDRAVLGSAPTLMQPLHSALPPCPLQAHRYVAARDGLYLQARSVGIDACLAIAPVQYGNLPYGVLRERVRLVGGRIPYTLYRDICAQAAAAAPNEWACLILFDPDEGYRVHVPDVDSRSAGHIRYQTGRYDPEQVVVDLHTHGQGEAFFSATDDDDDRTGGIYLSVVLGRCGVAHGPTQATRMAINGHLIPVNVQLWADD